jgi:hypothetical protein
MAEAAALALATSLLQHMQVVDVHFLVDNQLLVNFINDLDSSNPLDWRITPYTSTVKKFLAGSNSTRHRIRLQQRWQTSLPNKAST